MTLKTVILVCPNTLMRKVEYTKKAGSAKTKVVDCITIALLVILFADCKGGYEMRKTDVGRPEPVLFLELAASSMENYRSKHAEYADKWYLLDFDFVNGPYYKTDPGIRATREDGNRWQPKLCQYTYEIVSADKDKFLIQAKNTNNLVEYEMTQGMEEPKKVLLTPKDELCTIEQPKGKILPEPVMFLNAASSKFLEYHSRYGEYPKSWNQLDFHWALVPHKASDENVKPPAEGGSSWTPLGANFTYEIVKAKRDFYEIRSTNTYGLQNYRISSSDVSPVLIKK
jgi:hypothetical protein